MTSNKGQVQCTFFGTSSVYLTGGATGIFIDAFLTRPGLSKLKANEDIGPDAEVIRKTLQRGHVDKLDAIFVAHSHFDHVMDSPEVINQIGGRLFGSESTLNIGRGAGLSEEQMQLIHDGDEFVLDDFKVRIIEGEHSPGNLFPGTIDTPLKVPAKPSAYLDGGCYNFHITHPSGSILILASANYIPGKFEGVSTDVLYLGIGAMGSNFKVRVFEVVWNCPQLPVIDNVAPVRKYDRELMKLGILSKIYRSFHTLRRRCGLLQLRCRQLFNRSPPPPP